MRRIVLSAVFSLGLLSQAGADEPPTDAFPLRNHNPFLQIYGLPAFRTADLVPAGGIDVDVTIDIANDVDRADKSGESITIDGESRILNVSLRRRIGERFEVGLDVPYVDHSGGFLDNVIYEFHDLFGFPNSSRDGPDDQFLISFARDGTTLFEMNSPASGVGDVRLSAAMAFPAVTLRAGVKLPTGDPDKLTGSGAADVSLGVYGGGATSLFDRRLSWTGFFGVLALGTGDVLRDLQNEVVPYGGVALRWHATDRVSLATQLALQGPYFDADLRELGGRTSQLGFGADIEFPKQGWLLRLAIAEDIAGDAAPDVAFHLSIRRYAR